MDTNAAQELSYSDATDVGCVRELNEDSLYTSTNLWLVADGMGGHACGEVASQIAAENIGKDFASHGDLPKAIQNAHQLIIDASKNGIGQSGMGTTVVALTADKKTYSVAWVGDSRAYLWQPRRKRLTQLSEDHSFIIRLINAGLISKEDARQHPQRHMITQCLGSMEISEVQVDTVEGEWRPGEQILLCSDGLSDELEFEDLRRIMATSAKLPEKARLLIEAAKLSGGRDNISVVIVESPPDGNRSLWQKLKSLLS